MTCQSEIGRPLTLLNPGMDLGHGRLTCPFCRPQAFQGTHVLGIVSTALDRLKAGDSLTFAVHLTYNILQRQFFGRVICSSIEPHLGSLSYLVSQCQPSKQCKNPRQPGIKASRAWLTSDMSTTAGYVSTCLLAVSPRKGMPSTHT